MTAQNLLLQFSKWAVVACGVWLIGLGGYFMLLRPPLLPEDLRYLALTTVQVKAALPHLVSWLRNVFTVMGGFMAGCGVLIVFVGIRAVPQRVKGTGIAFGLAGLLTVATMSWINFVLGSDFKWLLLVPAVAWLIGFASYAAGTLAARTMVTVSKTDASPSQ